MLFIILFVLFSLGFTLLFYFLTNLSLWFLFLWVFLGILITALIVVVFCVLFLLIGSKTKPDSSFKHFVLRQGVKTFCILYHVKYSFEGTENIPNSTYVVYANHKSNMDPIFIYLGMNRKVTVIGKSTLVKNFWMKKIFETFGALPIDRDNDREAAKTIVKGIKIVKNGLPIIIFPEGGIKSRDTDEMVNLRAGAYKLATKANAPILPCSIIGSSKIKTKKLLQTVHVQVKFYKPILPSEYEKMNTTQIGLMVENIINEGIKHAEE